MLDTLTVKDVQPWLFGSGVGSLACLCLQAQDQQLYNTAATLAVVLQTAATQLDNSLRQHISNSSLENTATGSQAIVHSAPRHWSYPNIPQEQTKL